MKVINCIYWIKLLPFLFISFKNMWGFFMILWLKHPWIHIAQYTLKVMWRTKISLLCVSGLQVIFPEYLQEKFVQSALSYIMCNGEGEYMCRNNQCVCLCGEDYPQCNCPITDIQIMENTLSGMSESWASSYKDFENSGKLKTHKSLRITSHKLLENRTVLWERNSWCI